MSRPQTYDTKQGRALLSFLKEHQGEHFQLKQLCSALEQNRIPVGKTTVWRYLERLCESGQVRKASPDGKTACYTYGCCDSPHYHLQCTCCKRVIHLDCPQLDSLKAQVLAEHGFEMDSLRTTVQGLCRDCREQEGKQ